MLSVAHLTSHLVSFPSDGFQTLCPESERVRVRMEEVRGGGMEVKSGGREGGERIRTVNEKMRY